MDNDETSPAPTDIADLEPEADSRRRPRLRWIVGVVAIVAIAATTLVVVNCRDKTKSATVVLSEAASRTTGSGTAHVTIEGSVSGGGQHLKFVDGGGAVDYGSKRNVLTLKTGSLTEESRLVDGVAYVSVPGVALPHGAHWIAITAADTKLNPATASIGSADPSSGLDFLAAVAGNPRVVGTESVDGVKVTHYAFTLDMKAYFANVDHAASALKASSVGATFSALGEYLDLSSIPGEAWIDHAGRVHKFDILFDAVVQGEKFHGVDEFHFSHFNEPVDIQAPAASDTVAFRDDPDYFKQLAAAAAANRLHG